MPLPTATELFADPPLVGRSKDLTRLVDLLEHPPAVAVVRGEHGSGRSSVLAALGRAAVASGWRVLQPRPIRADTARAALARALRVLVGLPETPIQAAAALESGQRRGVAALGPVLAAEAWELPNSLLDGLADHPTLLLLDDYHANDEVESWLFHRLLDVLCRTEARVVTVIAGPAAHLTAAAERADEVVDVELPTESEIRQHLVMLGAHLHPPLDMTEVDSLAVEAAAAPNLLGPLIRALSHARADG